MWMRTHPNDSFVATVPLAERLPFTLCGKLLRQEADGSVSTHPIDNGGMLTNYADARLDALTIRDVIFSFADPAGQAEIAPAPGPACSAAVS